MSARVSVLGGGLAGSEAALQLASRGVAVDLYEMRPSTPTGAHTSDRLAEIVCSNSFKSTAPTNASGLLKEEMRRLGCFLLRVAEECRVDAGSALAVDREEFSARVTRLVESEPLVTLRREEARRIPDSGHVIVATGPLTSDPLVDSLTALLGGERLFFYDATSPVVSAESIDRAVVFPANRRDDAPGDYLNCPLDEDSYHAFVDALLAADRYPLHDFENGQFFEACMPVDELARRGRLTLAFGPMRPVGLVDPRTGERPFAVVQLRAENRAATAYNLVGFQNRLRHGEQRKVLRRIPGLEGAEFYRLGRIHRNTYLEAPRVLDRFLSARRDPRVVVAGQLTGLEGYVECVATGMLAGRFTAARLSGREPALPPRETALGSILAFCTEHDGAEYRPTNVSFGLFPPWEGPRLRRRERHAALADRARRAMDLWLERSPA